MKYIRVVADTNDADYIETFKPISDKDLERISPIIQAIKAFQPYQSSYLSSASRDGPKTVKSYHRHNYPTRNRCREDMGERPVSEIYNHVNQDDLYYFEEEYVPSNEFGIHTIKSIEILEITHIDKLI